MKKFLLTLTAIFICTIAYAHTINWHVGNTILQTTTCDSGESITPPTAPYKYGYHFVHWDGYAPIEYLESTGTQYIDTGFSPDGNTRVDWKGAFMRYDTLVPLIGARVTGDNPGRFLPFAWHSFDGTGRTTFGELDKTFPISISTIYTGSFRPTEGISIINNTTYDISNAQIVKRQENNIYLFATSGYGTNLYNSYGRIWYVKIYDNDVLVRDFIPVLDGNGTPCMYDRVEKKFYYNAGTGQFIAGPVISE